MDRVWIELRWVTFGIEGEVRSGWVGQGYSGRVVSDCVTGIGFCKVGLKCAVQEQSLEQISE